MKTGLYLSFAGLMGGLLVLSSCAFAGSGFPNDPMPHFGKDSQCSNHMVDPTQIVAAPPSQTMWMCKRSSGATTWSASIVKIAVPPVTACTRSSVPVATTSFTCNITARGSYKGTITYCVGSSCFGGHPELRWTIP